MQCDSPWLSGRLARYHVRCALGASATEQEYGEHAAAEDHDGDPDDPDDRRTPVGAVLLHRPRVEERRADELGQAAVDDLRLRQVDGLDDDLVVAGLRNSLLLFWRNVSLARAFFVRDLLTDPATSTATLETSRAARATVQSNIARSHW